VWAAKEAAHRQRLNATDRVDLADEEIGRAAEAAAGGNRKLGELLAWCRGHVPPTDRAQIQKDLDSADQGVVLAAIDGIERRRAVAERAEVVKAAEAGGGFTSHSQFVSALQAAGTNRSPELIEKIRNTPDVIINGADY